MERGITRIPIEESIANDTFSETEDEEIIDDMDYQFFEYECILVYNLDFQVQLQKNHLFKRIPQLQISLLKKPLRLQRVFLLQNQLLLKKLLLSEFS